MLGSVDLARVWPLPVCVVVTGCASILGIPSDSASFCARPENQGHDYCEDYDVGDAIGRLGGSNNEVATGKATMTIEPSDASAPNAIDFTAHATPPDAGHEVAGYFKTWSKQFVGIRVEADVKFLTHGKGALAPFAGYGFMLVGSSPGACLGMAVLAWPGDAGLPFATPVFSGVLVPQGAGGCGSLVALGAGGMPLGVLAAGDGGMAQLPPILPALDKWFHLTIQVAPSTSGDGSGVLLLRAGLSSQSLSLPKGTVPPDGQPIVGFASAPASPNTDEEVQFDNVTVDVAPQQLPPP